MRTGGRGRIRRWCPGGASGGDLHGREVAGAAYLVYLGVQAIWHRQSMAGALAVPITPVRPPRALRDGFVAGATKVDAYPLTVTRLAQLRITGRDRCHALRRLATST